MVTDSGASYAHIYWASGLNHLKFTAFGHFQTVVHVNRIRLFKRSRSSLRLAHSQIAPGLAEFLYLNKGAVHSIPAPVQMQLSEEFDAQIKLQRQD